MAVFFKFLWLMIVLMAGVACLLAGKDDDGFTEVQE